MLEDRGRSRRYVRPRAELIALVSENLPVMSARDAHNKEDSNMQVLQIINQPGPLPIKAQLTAPLDGPALLVVTSSLWATASNTLMQLNVALDGTQIATGKLWSNGASTHRALPTLFIGFPLSFGPHTLTLSLSGQNVTSDQNDFFNASLIY